MSRYLKTSELLFDDMVAITLASKPARMAFRVIGDEIVDYAEWTSIPSSDRGKWDWMVFIGTEKAFIHNVHWYGDCTLLFDAPI